MEYSTQDSLDQIEFLLSASTRGIHLLFDKDHLRETLQSPIDAQEYFTFENLNRVQDILTEMIQLPTFSEKIKYLQSLDPNHYELLIRTYFNIVENTVLESHPHQH